MSNTPTAEDDIPVDEQRPSDEERRGSIGCCRPSVSARSPISAS